jgi:imidazole glycerol phosphate synthase subunit HisF
MPIYKATGANGQVTHLIDAKTESSAQKLYAQHVTHIELCRANEVIQAMKSNAVVLPIVADDGLSTALNLD